MCLTMPDHVTTITSLHPSKFKTHNCFTGTGLLHHGKLLPPNSIILISDIGENNDALFCLTDSPDCCLYRMELQSRGAWVLPGSGTEVGSLFIQGSTTTDDDFYRLRRNGSLLLNRRNSATEPAGIFTCLVPSATDSTALPYYIGVYGSADEGESPGPLQAKYSETLVIQTALSVSCSDD